MKCPSCGSNEAYVGFNDIDCPNKTCRHFQGGASSLTAAPHGRNPTATLPAPNIHQPLVWPNIFPPNMPGIPVTPNNLSVRIVGQAVKSNNVQIRFIASGDPGNPDKDVEFYFDVGAGDQPCTLSHTNVTHISGVDADGTTIYTTNWLCNSDGVRPTDPFTLKAVIY